MGRSKTWGMCAAICLAAFEGLSGCSLPGSGPSASDIVKQASVEQTARYEVVDIDSTVVEAVKRWGPDSFWARFGDRKLSAEPVIGVGDAVTVTIWEAGPGGLFSTPLGAATEKVSTGSNSATVPEQVVGRDGGITVPYAGRVIVAGKTTRAVQRTIEQALEGKALQPQVLVNVTKATSDSVSVGGEVAMGARVPLSVRGDRILDVIDAAGGVKAPVNETFVELSRGSTTARIPLTRIIAYPKENIYLHPDDVVTLVRNPQTFLAYGATGANAEIPFDTDGISLAEALTKAGGLNDSRSDPQGVFIFRYEIEPIARALRPNSPLLRPGRLTPIVYRLNLTDANSLFLEQQFRIANHDLIYVSNSPSTDVQKVFDIFAPGLSTAGSVASIGVGAASLH
jgi:polysaccharide export outer membrane protein